jgi:hypothetical protein
VRTPHRAHFLVAHLRQSEAPSHLQVAQAKRLLFAELRVANLKRLLRMEAAFASAEVGAFGSA